MKEHIKDIYFWTGFYNDEDCCTWASNKAYLDMNRTMTFKEEIPKGNAQEEKRIKKQRAEWVAKSTDIIRQNLKTPPQADFNEWHKQTCTQIIDFYGEDKLVLRTNKARSSNSTKLTYGQAQKWVNMTLKYLWLLNRLDLISDNSIRNFIQEYEKSFHVPLDSYILKYVAKQNKANNKPFDSQNNCLNGDFQKYWELFKSEWSTTIDTEHMKEYYEYQSALAKAIKNSFPLEWELEHWHKALKYYG